MWDLGPGGIAPLGDILLQAGVGVAVPCTIALVIQSRWLHRADEFFTCQGDFFKPGYTLWNRLSPTTKMSPHLYIYILYIYIDILYIDG